MKVTVIKPLNVRVGSPSVNAPCYQYLAEGSQLEVDGQLYKGDAYDNIDTWLKDAAGNYYWSGGVSEFKSNVLTPLIDKSKTSAVKYRIDDLLKISMPPSNGQNIIVALLDSGVSNHPALSKKIIGTIDDDSFGHGTGMAGIITGQDDRMEGVSIGAKIINYKVGEGRNVDCDLLLSTLSKLVSQNPIGFDIINMSLDVHTEYVKPIQAYINAALSQGVITIVAAGADNFLNNIAGLTNVIKIGVIDSAMISSIPKIPTSYNIVFLNREIKSLTINKGYDNWGDESSYTALSTGIIASFLGANPALPKDQSRLNSALTFLTNQALQYNQGLLVEPFKPYTP